MAIKTQSNDVFASEKVKWEGAHLPYLQLGELNCEGRSSRGLVERILKAPRAAAFVYDPMLRSTATMEGLAEYLS